jgi:hypothetical protein
MQRKLVREHYEALARQPPTDVQQPAPGGEVGTQQQQQQQQQQQLVFDDDYDDDEEENQIDQ